MQQATLLTRLKAEFDTLPPQLQQAARWVLDHPADVALLTTREQARRSGLTPATFTRLAQRLGLDGFDAVRAIHAAAMRQRPDSFHGRAEELIARHAEEGAGALAQDLFGALAQHMQALREPDSLARFERAADLILAARRVFCFGLRSAFPAAYVFDYIRALTGAPTILADTAGGRGIDVLRLIGPGDLLFAISVAPYTRLTVQAAEYARGRGAAVVALTDSTLSPLARLADEALIVRTETPSFFHSMTPAFAAAECLAALIAAKQGQPALDAIAKSEAQLDAFSTFLTARPGKRGEP
jgi:DNA-binding MurR/RpiR family transcriptional regulator